MLKRQHLVFFLTIQICTALEWKNYTQFQHLSPTFDNFSALNASSRNEDLNITQIRLEMLTDLKQIVHFVDEVLHEKNWENCNQTKTYRKRKYFSDKEQHRNARLTFGFESVKKRNSTRRISDCQVQGQARILIRKLIWNEKQMEHFLHWMLMENGKSWATIACIENFHLYFNSTLEILDQLQVQETKRETRESKDFVTSPNETNFSEDEWKSFQKDQEMIKSSLDLDSQNHNRVIIIIIVLSAICLTFLAIGLCLKIKTHQKFQRLAEESDTDGWTEIELNK